VPTRGRTLPAATRSLCVGSDPKTRFILALSGSGVLHAVSLVGPPRACSPIHFPPRAPPPRLLPLSLGSRCCSDDATLMHRSDLSLDPAGVVPFPSSTRDHRHLLLSHLPLSKKSQTLNDDDSSSPRQRPGPEVPSGSCGRPQNRLAPGGRRRRSDQQHPVTSYIKFVEAAGARVIPLGYDEPNDRLLEVCVLHTVASTGFYTLLFSLLALFIMPPIIRDLGFMLPPSGSANASSLS
jgi:hypothetical protein